MQRMTITLNIDNHDIRKTGQIKLLGVYIDEIESQQRVILASYVRELESQKVGILVRLRNLIPCNAN